MTQEAQQAAAPAVDRSLGIRLAGVTFVSMLRAVLAALCLHDTVRNLREQRLESRYLERRRMDLAADLDELGTTELRAAAHRESAEVVPMLLVNSRMGEYVSQYGHQARVLTLLIEDELRD